MLDIQAAKKRCEAAKKAKPQDGVALLWVRRYREDVSAALEALAEARGLLKEIVNAKPARLRAAVFAAESYLGESE
jgi:hypothetical protein